LRALDPGAAARESLLLGRAVIGHLLRDPVLPTELMSPEPRIALVAAMKSYQTEARRLWRQWLAAAAAAPEDTLVPSP
jgi:phenylacetic acid degradation operon negative regulatory protein